MARPDVYEDAIAKGVKIVTTDEMRAIGPEATIAEEPQGGNVWELYTVLPIPLGQLTSPLGANKV